MKYIFTVIVILGLAGGGYFLWKKQALSGGPGGYAARPTTARVIQTNINFAVNAAGEISPAEQVSVPSLQRPTPRVAIGPV